MDTMNQAPLRENAGGSGPIVGIIIIILLLAAGGLYFFQMERGIDGDEQAAQLQQSTEDPQTEALKTVGTSDAASSIEEDLGATDLGDFDATLGDIEAQL